MQSPFDWDYWRLIFIENNLTLAELSEMKGAPSLPSIKRKCAKEKWMEQKILYIQAAGAIVSKEEPKPEPPPLKSVRDVAKAAVVEIDREVQQLQKMFRDLEKVGKVADAMLYRPLQRFAEMNLDELSPRDIATFVRLGWDIKCKLIELDAARINWDSPNIKRMFGGEEIAVQSDRVDQ